MAILAFIPAAVHAQDIDLHVVTRSFYQANIPQRLGIIFRPKVLFEVSFPELFVEPGLLPLTITAGIRLPRNATMDEPMFRIIGDNGEGPFIILMVDVDAPTHPTPATGEFRHFLGANFFLNDVMDPFLLSNSTPALSEYQEPHPILSEPHRYAFLIFSQPDNFNDSVGGSPFYTTTSYFNLTDFISQTGLGQPCGGTYMIL
ncbi:PEBP-like protein [Agrocybe pediades]|nr:PEBP-like protein [Agrocybe pediades]